MRRIDDYMDLAKERAGLASDRQLSDTLCLSPTVTSKWRTARAFPTDEAMCRLADLCGIHHEVALTELGYWRTTSRNEHLAAQAFYELADKLVKQASVVLIPCILTLLLLAPSPASAGTFDEQAATAGVAVLYYVK